MRKFYLLVLSMVLMVHINAQQARPHRCGTMEALNEKLKDPQFKAKFEANREELAARAKSRSTAAQKTTAITDTVPVVVHIILANPNTVTDAICQSQLDVLNEDFQGKNADTTRIPAAFKSKFGRGNLTFMLAKTDPNGLPTTGIERRTNNITFTDVTYKNGKQYSTGGMDGWDPTKYFNMWVVQFTDGTLGISVFPGDPDPATQHGYMCDYRCWGRGASYLYSEFNKGRTATHEIGHFWNLYHIWGDDNGSCSGVDFYSPYTAWDDTPNQADASSGDLDPSGTGVVKTDACATTAPGYMYQNYMDYTDDIDLVMFTKGQWQMMEYVMANATDRAPLFTSTTYNAPPNFQYDAGINTITEPANGNNFCASATIAAPKVQLTNYGTATLTSVKIYGQVNGAAPVLAASWTGSLAQYAQTIVTLPAITLASGSNSVKYYTELPNGVADQNTANDTKTSTVTYTAATNATLPLNNGFESGVPGTNWTLRNPDNGVTWTVNTSAYKSGTRSAKMDFYNYDAEGQEDWLISPMINFPTASYDSAFISFYHAYRNYNANYLGDSLKVLISVDCGNTWNSVWSYGGVGLRTVTSASNTSFTPTATQWSALNKIDIRNYRDNNLYVAFRARNGWSNNLYLDDISVYGIAKALPVKLLYFRGNSDAGINKLTWATSTEINAGYYSIERSTNGRDFTAIGKVDAAGNTNAITNYSYNDNSFAAGINYYRLKVVDKDGSYSYSSIIAIKDGAPANIVSVYPNPAKDVLFVQVKAYEAQKATIAITDMQGRIVNTQMVQLANGNNNTSINVNSLPKGMYMITVNAKDKTVVKFVKE